DLSEEVGALATKAAMSQLDADPGTELIVVVSKPPAETVAADLQKFADPLSTPVQFALLGDDQADLTKSAADVLTRVNATAPEWPHSDTSSSSMTKGQLRGLVAGCTLCDASIPMARDSLGPVYSNIPHDPAHAPESTM